MKLLAKIDRLIIGELRVWSEPLARTGLFIVFSWFGVLKVIGESPANPLVSNLLEQTLPFITFEQFILFFGLYEMLIGILFLIPKCERAAIALLVPHMATTFMPLIMLPSITWQSPFVPTLEGQYIIKNIIIIGLAFGIGAHLAPIKTQSASKKRIA